MITLTDTLPLVIGSPSFQHGGMIPRKYSCEGDNISPPLTIQHIPPGTRSMALIVEDPDAPQGVFDHWIVWNILPMEALWENTIPGIVGKNGKGTTAYTGPCPPSGLHHYFFKIYALDTMLDLREGASKKALQQAMAQHILAIAEFVGLYQKS